MIPTTLHSFKTNPLNWGFKDKTHVYILLLKPLRILVGAVAYASKHLGGQSSVAQELKGSIIKGQSGLHEALLKKNPKQNNKYKAKNSSWGLYNGLKCKDACCQT